MGTTEAVVAMTAIILGSLMFLIPIAGITARIALKPLTEALARYREMQGDKAAAELTERRVSLLEEQLHSIDRSIRELTDAAEFNRELQSGPRRQRLAAPAPTPVTEDS